jgi:hypothetical protein
LVDLLLAHSLRCVLCNFDVLQLMIAWYQYYRVENAHCCKTKYCLAVVLHNHHGSMHLSRDHLNYPRNFRALFSEKEKVFPLSAQFSLVVCTTLHHFAWFLPSQRTPLNFSDPFPFHSFPSQYYQHSQMMISAIYSCFLGNLLPRLENYAYCVR